MQDAPASAAMAVDGNWNTRWSSRFNDDEWIEIDLGSAADIVGVRLHWEAAFGRRYDVLVSQDGSRWQTAFWEREGDGMTDDVYFGRRRARFVRIAFHKRGTPWGYSLWEIETKGLDEEIRISGSAAAAEHPSTLAMDGDPSTEWLSGAGEASLTMEMPASVGVIGEVTVDWADAPTRSSALDVSTDGKSWTTVWAAREAAGDRTTIRVNLVRPKFIRLCGASEGNFGVREIGFKKWSNLASRSGLDRARGLAGWIGGPFVTYVGRDGTFAPEPHAHEVTFWVYDHAAQVLHTPQTLPTSWELSDGRIPVNVVSWKPPGAQVTTTVFARSMPDKRQWLTFARTTLRNDAETEREFTLFAVLRPNPLARAKGNGVKEIAYDGRGSVRVNGAPGLHLMTPADAVSPALKDVLEAFGGVRPLQPKSSVSDGGGNASGALAYTVRLQPGSEQDFDFVAPSGESVRLDTSELDFDRNLRAVKTFWRELVPVKLEVSDKRYSDAFYSSVYYILLMMRGTELHPGPYGYNTFFLHDAVDMAIALDKAGLHDIAEKTLPHFEYHETDNYLDGLPATIFTLYEHYRLTQDRGFLAAAWPKIRSYAEMMRRLRSRQLGNRDAVEHGLLPKSASQDNFTMHAYLYYDNWYGVAGYKSALEAAKTLGKSEDVAWLTAEYEALLKAITDSARKVMKRDGISYIPALADAYPVDIKNTIDEKYRIFGATQMAWAHRPAVDPGHSLGIPAPLDLLKASYQYFWQNSGRFSGYDGGWYVEYEKFFWGYNVMLARPLQYVGMGDVALKNIEWSLRHPSCPGGWMEAMNTKENDSGLREIDEGIVGDVPHGWVAAHYVTLLRDMLLREEKDRIVMLPNIPAAWLAAGKTIEIANLPTYFGKMSMRVKSYGERLSVEIDMPTPPSGGYLLRLPSDRPARSVRINGVAADGMLGSEIELPPETHSVLVE